ncbi:hypothetical protein SRHO_G00191110 [Serrasalmus rhombeus]
MDVPQPTDQDGQREPAEQGLTTASAPADTPGSPEHPTPVVTMFGRTVKPNPRSLSAVQRIFIKGGGGFA